MLGKVEVWQMTEEERQAYIKKHPINATKPPKGSSFMMTEESFKDKHEKARKSRWGHRGF